MLTIEEFCDRHKACKEGRDWALANCESMLDAWDKLPPGWLVWVATRQGVLTDKELRFFAVSCSRSVEHLMKDHRSRDAIDIAERFSNGEATDQELAAARSAARAAAWVASSAARESALAAAKKSAWAARAAAWVAWASAWDSTDAAAREAAWAAARAAWAAASAAAWAADDAAARKSQADWLRANTRPNFH